ncbi:MAG: 2,3-bisphosphoglycerate-independent phosphoglycerate mutase, partial [Bacteroidia bacterium]|nr:2,3-bisphosphoglycerate-independent phosphoglycerate mutase [Bacteroidia bacterium]
MQNRKAFLMILDGWGIGKHDFTDGIYNANTPFFNHLLNSYPNTTLTTFGNAVGLPEGQMGNSEVGHMNIGAGRVVWQQLALINKKFEDGSAADVNGIVDLANYCIQNNKPLHLIGLVSDGGVHSSIEHLIALCKIFTDKGVKEINIHAFTDGRDTDPKSGKGFLSLLQNAIIETNARIVSVIGRYYAMDRDKRWERVKLAYDLLVNGNGKYFNSALDAIDDAYAQNITDEFIMPSVIVDENQIPLASINEGDAVLCFNFRTDRGRQITQVLTQSDMHEFNMHRLNLYYATMTEYDSTYQNVKVIFESKNVTETLGEVISQAGLKQLRSAETEKYPHVTFFFSGGREEVFPGEVRIMEPSPKVPTYDLQPEMSALPLTDKIEAALDSEVYDFICLNFANTDMVGHTGVWEAIIKAAETVDACVERLVKKALEHQYQLIIIADHGNSDEARNPDGSPNTAHSMNPVPCIIISDKCNVIPNKGK